uniref:Uncharacterized protein n=1 Tax=Avena sativa TaxID=4498 RepID=A0ACD5UIE2_AVESA
MTTTTKISLLLLVLAPLLMAAAGKDCPGVPWLGAVAACRKASGTKLIYNLCISTMRDYEVNMSPSHREAVTAYVINALEAATNSYEETGVAASNQIDNTSLSHQARDAFQACVGDDYLPAEHSLDHIDDALRSGCDFAGLTDACMSGMMSLERCRDRLMSLQYSDSVYSMILVDRQRVSLAYSLSKLLGI